MHDIQNNYGIWINNGEKWTWGGARERRTVNERRDYDEGSGRRRLGLSSLGVVVALAEIF